MVKNFLIVHKNLQQTQWKLLQKTAEATGYLIGNKIVDKITNAAKSSKKLHSQNNLDETDIPKERYL